MNTDIHLVFLTWGGDTGIFYREEDYPRFHQIAVALRTSRTWGEFRSTLPDGEFEKLYHWVSNDGEYIYKDGNHYLFIKKSRIKDFLRSHGEAYVITSTTPFDPELLGVLEGDYPPWMSETAADLHLLPPEFIQDYGQGPDSLLVNGPWWVFPVERFDEMKLRLEAAGFTVSKTDTGPQTPEGW